MACVNQEWPRNMTHYTEEEAPPTGPSIDDVTPEMSPRDIAIAKVRAAVNNSIKPIPVVANRARYRDPSTIAPRPKLLGGHYARGFISVTGAVGGTGKTNQSFVDMLSMASGRDLLGYGLYETDGVKGWCIGLEDPLEEYERRLLAAAKYYRIPANVVNDNIFLDSGRDQKFLIAEEDKQSGISIVAPVVDSIVGNIVDNKMGYVIIDPFVKLHRIAESDNGRIDQIGGIWGAIAEATNIAVD
jgi:hypothetical protein